MYAVLLVYVADNSERFYGAKKIRATSAPVVQNIFRSANGISFLATTSMGNVNLVSLAESIVRTAQRKNDEIFDGSSAKIYDAPMYNARVVSPQSFRVRV